MTNLLIGISTIIVLIVMYCHVCKNRAYDFILFALAFYALTLGQMLGGSLLIIRLRHLAIPFLLVGIWLRRSQFRGRKGIGFWTSILLFVLLLLSSAWHDTPMLMFKAKFRLIFLSILLIFGGYAISYEEDIRKLVFLLLPTAAFILIVAVSGQLDVSSEDNRISINEVNQNGVGVAFGTIILILYANIVYQKRFKALVYCLIPFLGFSLLRMMQTGSRSSAFAFVAAIMTMSYVYIANAKRKPIYFVLIAILGLIISIYVWKRLDASLIERLLNVSSFSGREVQWEWMAYDVKKHSPLLGMGGWMTMDFGDPHWLGALSIYYDYFFNCGYLGVVIGTFFVIMVLKKSLLLLVKHNTSAAMFAVSLCMLGFLHGFGEDGATRGGNFVGYFWGLGLGLLSGYSRPGYWRRLFFKSYAIDRRWQ